MSRIRSRGNAATELRFIQILRNHKVTGWRRGTDLPGHPDFVFRKERVVVFVDGDFWHGNPRKFRLPKSNLSYWEQKILSNRRRDKRITRKLRNGGWIVVRFWQTSLKNEKIVIERLKRHLHENSQGNEAHDEFYSMVADEPAFYSKPQRPR